MRSDPLLALLAGKRQLDERLAGKSTLNRLQLAGRSLRYHKITYSAEAIDRLLADVYFESHAAPPEQVVLDLDATDVPLYGHQPERFFHGYYGPYGSLPRDIVCGEFWLAARLRPSNLEAAAGGLAELQRMVQPICSAWPQVRIIVRGDSDSCRKELMLV